MGNGTDQFDCTVFVGDGRANGDACYSILAVRIFAAAERSMLCGPVHVVLQAYCEFQGATLVGLSQGSTTTQRAAVQIKTGAIAPVLLFADSGLYHVGGSLLVFAPAIYYQLGMLANHIVVKLVMVGGQQDTIVCRQGVGGQFYAA